jgi:hypothetical protein
MVNIGSVLIYDALEVRDTPGRLDALDWEISKVDTIYLATGSILFFLLLFLVEALHNSESFMRIFLGEETAVKDTFIVDEEDVARERVAAISAKH